MNTDGSDQTLLADTFGQLMDWSLDGRFVVFGGASNLNVILADGSGLTTIPIGLDEPNFPDWEPLD